MSDVWVFERGVGNAVPNPRWRLAARLSVPPLSEGETVGGERLDPEHRLTRGADARASVMREG